MLLLSLVEKITSKKSGYMFSTDAISCPNAFNLLLVGVCKICEYM